MKYIWTALVLALPAFTACSGSDLTAPQASEATTIASLAALERRETRSFGGRCETNLAVSPPHLEDGPNILRLRITYNCRLTHLGRVTAIAEQIVTFTGPTTAIASNRTTYTAANGDKLFATWTGTSTTTGPDVTFSGLERYAGGTGRFAHARGNGWISGAASFVTFKGQFLVKGKLSY